MENAPHISIAPEVLGNIAGVAITNSFLSSICVSLILIALIFYVRVKLSIVPGTIQLAAEGIITFFYNQLLDAYGDEKRAKRFLPLIIGLFLFIFLSNQFTIIPLVQSVVLDGVDVFRAPTSHFSLTVTLALITFLVSNLIAISMSPWLYVKNFIKIGELLKVRCAGDLAKAFLDIFLGVLDIIGELAKVISLSARLFGNIFAGEVMVVVIASLSAYTQFFVPAPFYALGLLSGLIQALVFSVLSLSFIAGMHTSMEAAKEEAKKHKEEAGKRKLAAKSIS